MTVRQRAGLGILATLLLPGSVGAQRGIRVAATVAHADHRVEAGFGPERSSGFLVGTEVRLEVGRGLAFAVAGSAGHLAADAADAIDRDVAQLNVSAQLAPLAWLALEAGLTVRTYSTVVARQRWTLGRASAEARVPLSGDVLHVLGRASLFPLVSVNGLPGPDVAFETAVGLGFARGRWAVDLRYSLERCDFPFQGAGERSEQLTALVLRVGWAPFAQ